MTQQDISNQAARESQAAALRAEGFSEAAISEAAGAEAAESTAPESIQASDPARQPQVEALAAEGATREEISEAVGESGLVEPAPEPAPDSGDDGGPSEATSAETRALANQVISALQSGANVSAAVLRQLNLSESTIAKINSQQRALREVRNTPGVMTGDRFNLGMAIRRGVSLETLALAGFSPEDINKASEGADKGITGVLDIPVKAVPDFSLRFGDEDRLIETEEEIAARVQRQRFDRASAALAAFLEFDADGIMVVGIRIEDALKAGARTQDLLDLGLGQPVIDAAKRSVLINSPTPLDDFIISGESTAAAAKVTQNAALADLTAFSHALSGQTGFSVGFHDYVDDAGRIDTVRALRDGVAPQVLVDAGVPQEQVDASAQLGKELGALETYYKGLAQTGATGVRFGDDVAAARVDDVLKEALSFTFVETQNFDEMKIKLRYVEAAKELGNEWDRVAAEAEATGSRVLTSKNDFINQNIGTMDAYVGSVLAAQPALASLAKEFGLAMIPIYGTIRTWDESPDWARALGIASDLLFIVPIVGQVSAATRAGTGLLAASRQVAIAQIKGPINAVRSPFRAARATAEPFETLLVPSKIPINALEVREVTIKLPVLDNFIAQPGDLKIPTSSLVGIDPRSPLAGSQLQRTIFADELKGLAEEPAVLAAMEWRDRVTLQAIRGEPAGTAGDFTGTILRPSLQDVVGPAALHAAPDLRPFIGGTVVGGGKTGGKALYVAPGLTGRFVPQSASGVITDLSPAVKEAIALGKLSEDTMPGVLLIRDTELLDQLSKSGKLWQGTAEIERTLDVGVTIPPPSQFLFTRGPSGERITIAVVGDPLSPAQLAKLKIVGIRDTITSIFKRPGAVTKTGVDDAVESANDSAALFVRAQEADARGAFAEARALRNQATEAADKTEELLGRAKLRAADDISESIEPVAVYTGEQDVVKAISALGDDAPTPPVSRVRKETLRTGGVSESRVIPEKDLLARGGSSVISSTTGVRAVPISPQRIQRGVVTPGQESISGAPVRTPAERAAASNTAIVRSFGFGGSSSRVSGLDSQPSRVTAPRPDPTRVTSTRAEAPRVDEPRVATTRAEAPRVEAPRVEAPRVDAPRVEAPRVDTPRVDTPRVDTPRVDTPRVDAPRVDAPRVDAPRVDAPRVTPPRIPTPSISPPKPVAPRILLPNGQPLPAGTFPLIVTWGQGENRGIINLQTGRVRWVDRDPDGQSPSQTFVATQTTLHRPPPRTFRMGFEDVSISGDSITFETNRLAKRDPLRKKRKL